MRGFIYRTRFLSDFPWVATLQVPRPFRIKFWSENYRESVGILAVRITSFAGEKGAMAGNNGDNARLSMSIVLVIEVVSNSILIPPFTLMMQSRILEKRSL